MNKKFNIIKLSGLKGLFLLLFIGACLLTGFLVFPGWVCMNCWNFVSSYFYEIPPMNLLHGVILWCILALSIYAWNKGDFWISFGSVTPNDERLKHIISKKSVINELKEETTEEEDKITK